MITQQGKPGKFRRITTSVICSIMIFVCLQISVLVGAQEKKVVTIWHWMSGLEIPKAAWDARLGYFIKTHPNIDLRLEVTPWNGYTDKLIAAGSAGKLPDIFGTGGVAKVDVGLMGFAEPLNEYIEKEGGDIYLADYPAGLLYPYKGTLYALPDGVGVSAMFYNTRMFKEAGIAQPPKTWEDFVDVAIKLTNPAKDQWGFSANGVSWGGMREWTAFLYQAGGTLVDAEGKCSLNTPEGREAFQFMVDLITKYKVIPDWAGSNEQISRTNFINQKTAMIQFAHYLRGQIMNMAPDLPYDIAVQPRNKTTGSVIYGSYICLSAQSQQKDLAWDVLKFITNEESELIYTVLAGFLANRKSNLEKTYYANNPGLEAFAQQLLLPNAYDGFPVPKIRPRYDILMKGMQEVVFGKKTTDQALADIEKEWNAIE